LKDQTTAAADSGLWVRQLGPAGRGGQTTELIARSTYIGNAALASKPGGGAVLAWTEGGPVGTYDATSGTYSATLNVASRGADGTWSAPVVLQRGRALLVQNSPTVAVAIDAGGDSIVVSQTLDPARYSLMAWPMHAGHAGTPITIAPKAYANVLRAAITNTGTAIVAWSQQSIGLDVDSAMSVSAVSLDRAKSRVGNVITLDHGTRSEVARPGFELVASPTGGATLAWSQVDKRGDEISVANADNGGKFQRRHQIIRGAAELGGLAIRDDGTELLTASPSVEQGPPQRVVAWIRPPGASQFSELGAVPVPREALVAPFDTSGSIDQGTIDQAPLSRGVPGPVFDPKTGDALIAFTTSGRPAGGTPQLIVLRRPLP